MSFEFLDAVIGAGKLVFARDLPSETEHSLLNRLFFHSGRAVRIEDIRYGVVSALIAQGRQKPKPVFEDWTTNVSIEILNLLNPVDAFDTAVLQALCEIVGLEETVAARAAEKKVAMKRVASVLWYLIDQGATAGHFGGKSTRLVSGLLNDCVVHVVLNGAIQIVGVDVHPVH